VVRPLCWGNVSLNQGSDHLLDAARAALSVIFVEGYIGVLLVPVIIQIIFAALVDFCRRSAS
jgi:hypothetical protein